MLIETDPPPVRAFVAYLATLMPEQRVKAIDAIVDNYCLSCGCQQPAGARRCQCDNDD